MSTCSTASNSPAAKQHSPAVVYLDFDGVLHHHNVLWSTKRGPHLDASAQDVLFQHAELLLGLIRPYPDIRIVLSTSWVLKYGCYGAARRLPAELRARVIGATFHSKMDRTTFEDAFRGMQVWGDVYRRCPRDWFAIDDDYLQWPAWCRQNLVRTHPEKGINVPETLDEIRVGLKRISAVNSIDYRLQLSRPPTSPVSWVAHQMHNRSL